MTTTTKVSHTAGPVVEALTDALTEIADLTARLAESDKKNIYGGLRDRAAHTAQRVRAAISQANASDDMLAALKEISRTAESRPYGIQKLCRAAIAKAIG